MSKIDIISISVIIGMLSTASILIFMWIRSEVVYNIRKKARNIIFQSKHMRQRYLHLLDRGYDAMFDQLLKWRFKDFYPELEKYNDKNSNEACDSE